MYRLGEWYRSFYAWVADGDLLKFMVYGETMSTKRTKRYLFALSLILLLQMVVDLWAWTRLWAFALRDSAWMYPLGFVFAAGILVLDWTIITHDLTGSRLKAFLAFSGRIALLVGVSLLTSVSVELSVFNQEIERELDRKEKVAADEIRQQAIREETARYAQRLETDSASGQGSADRIVNDRKEQRPKLLEEQRVKRAEITKRLSNKERDAVREVNAAGISRRLGRGAVWRTIEEQRKDNRAELAAFDKASQEELTAYDRETERLRNEASALSDASYKSIQKVLDDKVAFIRAMSPKELAVAYPGDWMKSRGPMDRYRELQVVLAADPDNVWVLVGCRLLMLFIGLIILLLKFLAPPEFVSYFNIRAQAVAGNEDAKSVLIQQGYNVSMLNRSIGWGSDVRAMLRDLGNARIKTRNAIQRFRKAFHAVCRSNPDTGLCRTRPELRDAGSTKWADIVSPALDALDQIENRLLLNGVEIPTWPESLGEQDPRISDLRPWEETDKDLAKQFGWEDPTERLLALKQTREQAVGEMETLISLLNRMHANLMTTHSVRHEEVLSARKAFYVQNVLPIVERLESVEKTLKSAGFLMPAWPKGLETEESRRRVWSANVKPSHGVN